MFQKEYYVDKLTSTPADVMMAFGFAKLLYEVAEGAGVSVQVWVRHAGSSYIVSLSQAVEEAWLDSWVPGLPYLAAGKHGNPALPPKSPIYPYEAEKERRATYFELVKQLRKLKLTPNDPEWEQVYDSEPHPGHEFFAKINQMSAIIAYNGLVEQWLGYASQPQTRRAPLEMLLALFQQSPNPLEQVVEQWKAAAKAQGWAGKPYASAMQVVNPGMGKGNNRSKADAVLAPGNQENFWLLEYLKFLGAQGVMVPRVVQGSKDRKSYVLEPRNLALRTGERLFREFQQALWASTHIKMDILAVLRWVEVFLVAQTSGSGSERLPHKRLAHQHPGDFVEGLWSITYKDLGSAHAVINISLLRLPRWMRAIESEADVQRYLAIVAEHRRIVDTLEEKHSDAQELLRLYRDFLSGSSLRAFFSFCAGYSSYLMQRMEQRKFAPPFTLPSLEELFMAHPDEKRLSPILTSLGFQHVAAAIRHSTVIPQYRKVQGERLYEIRYGLGSRLLQKSRYANEFARELSEFMFQYNQENGRVAEQRRQQFRRNLTTEDVAQVITLIDEYGVDTVAGLLVAYGYAREPRSDARAEDPAPDASDEMPDETLD